MFTSNLTPEQRVQKSAVDIMANQDFAPLAGILMLGKRRVEHQPERCPTAYTDGKNVVFGAHLIDKLNDRQLRFVDLHEQYHKLYRHLTTWRELFDENPQLANIACDYVINLKLHDYDPDEKWIAYPKFDIGNGKQNDVLIDVKYRGWNAREVYEDLRKKHGNQQGKGQGQGQGGQGQCQGQGQGQGGDLPQGFDDHGWDDAKSMTEEERKQLERDIDEAIRQGAKIAGKQGTSNMAREFGEILKPQVDWRAALAEFVSSVTAGRDYATWNRPNRRFIGAGVYMPSGITERVDEFVFAIDVSGSISTRELQLFMSEAVGAVKAVRPRKLRIIYWDGHVCGVETYDEHEIDDFDKVTRPNGGGATRVEVVCDYLQENKIRPDACLIMTDGYLGGSWGTWHCPVMWVIVDNENAVPDTGKTLHVEARNL